MSAVAQKIRTICTAYPVAFDLLLLTAAYTLAYGLMFFNHGVFWDDWILYNMDHALIIEKFKQLGLICIAHLHILTLSGGVVAYRIVTFTCYLIAAWSLYGIVRELNIDRYSRFFLVSFFAFFPVNSARITMITLPYSICYALFFIGFWLTSCYLQSRRTWLRITALTLLLISFITNSLLVFYLIIILYIMNMEQPKKWSFSGWLGLVTRYADYLMLPILFWIVKKTYMKPYGSLSGYNNVDAVGIWQAVTLAFRVFEPSFLAVFDKISGYSFLSKIFNKAASSGIYFPFAGAIIIIIVLMLYKYFQKEMDRELFETLGLFILGGFIFWLAAFPYATVGKVPELEDWGNRHQLLIPLGASILLVYGVKLLSKQRAITLSIYLILMFAFIHVTIQDCIAFQRDWYKQRSLIENMRNSSEIRNNRSFLVKDETADLNCNSRVYRFYEYTGMMKKSFKDELRFAEGTNAYAKYFKNIQALNEYFKPSWSMGSFIKKEPDLFIIISRGITQLDAKNVFKMMWWERMDKEAFSSAILGIVSLKVVKL